MSNELTTNIASPIMISDTSTPRHGVDCQKKSSFRSTPPSSLKLKKIDSSLLESTTSTTSFDQSMSSLYEWRTFNDNCAQLLLTDLITENNEERNCENENDVKEASASELETLRDLFRENASGLYHDIVEMLNCSEEIAQAQLDVLLRRYEDFSMRTGILAANLPILKDEIESRSTSIRLQLNILIERTSSPSGLSNYGSTEEQQGVAVLHHLRKWLKLIDAKMNSVDEVQNNRNAADLRKFLLNQQKLQVEIQRDGGALLAVAKKVILHSAPTPTTPTSLSTVAKSLSSDAVHKLNVELDSLERRWHSLWIRSIERQCTLEALIKRIELGIIGDFDCENDLFEPATKRRRLDDVDDSGDAEDDDVIFSGHQQLTRSLASSNGGDDAGAGLDCCSVTSDTIPFSESEYESIMESGGGRGNVLVVGDATDGSVMDANGNFYSPLTADYSSDGDDFYCSSNDANNVDLTSAVGRRDAIAAANGARKLMLINEGQDVGYASENSMHLSSNDESSMFECNNKNATNDVDNDERFTRSPSAPLMSKSYYAAAAASNEAVEKLIEEKQHSAWSASSSPSLERRNRIHNSPVKEYYRMVVADTTDVDSDGAKVCDSSATADRADFSVDTRYVYAEKINVGPPQGMTDSLFVNVSDSVENLNEKTLHEIVALLDASFDRVDNYESAAQLDKRMDDMFGRGTTWRPFVGSKKTVGDEEELQVELEVGEDSCDASSEMSADDVRVRLMHADADDLPFVDRGSLKRRWRRPTVPHIPGRTGNCLTELFSNSTSDAAIMSMSAISTTASDAPLRRQHLQRKKLKARRIPRSISDSEHLSVLALCSRPSSFWSNPRLNVAPPCTPFGSLVFSDDGGSGTELEDEEAGGAGEGLADNEERMAGDGGSSVSAEQSESVWEWDDYKPPNHSEFGPLDSRLDDSKLTEFGDDYRLCLDSAPPSARSDVSGMSATAAISPHFRRLPPVGFSCTDSESERENGKYDLENSLRQLQHMKNVFDKQIDFEQLSALCDEQVRYLKSFVQCASAKKEKELKLAKRLLSEYQSYFEKIEKRNEILRMFSENLRKFYESLQNASSTKNAQGKCDSSFDDLYEETVKLNLASVHIKGERDSILMRPETKVFAAACEQAVEKCLSQVRTNILELLRKLKNEVCEMSKNVCSIRNDFSSVDDFDRKHRPNVENERFSADVKALTRGLELCEDRLNRLETVCNQISTSIGSEVSKYEILLQELREELKDVRGDLNRLLRELNSHTTSQEESITTATARRRPRAEVLPTRSSSSEAKSRKRSIDAEAKVELEKINDTNKSDVRTSGGGMKKFRKIMRYSWPLQLCLLFAVCVGAYFFNSMDCCDNVNNLNWAFGARLKYVRGAPPS